MRLNLKNASVHLLAICDRQSEKRGKSTLCEDPNPDALPLAIWNIYPYNGACNMSIVEEKHTDGR
jgi:hypothetical protein